MNNKTNTERQLAAESLEGRSMMAGDIAASVQGGILYLRGDEAANGVLIRNAEGGKLEVVGTSAGGATTTINGGTRFLAEGATLGVTAVLGAGADVIAFANAADEAGVAPPVSVRGGVVVNAGAGNDRVSGRINNQGAVALHMGQGHDQVRLGGSAIGTLVVNSDPAPRALQEPPPPGNDQVSLLNVRAARAAVVRTGGGNDVVQIRGGAYPLSLSVTADGGDDRVEIGGSNDVALAVGAALSVNGGDGNDTVNIERVNVRGALTVAGGSDDDLVNIEHATAVDGIFAAMMGGADSLTIRESASARAVLTGGLGADTLVLEGNDFDELIRVGF